jgi:hypothetical protein
MVLIKKGNREPERECLQFVIYFCLINAIQYADILPSNAVNEVQKANSVHTNDTTNDAIVSKG